LLTLVPAVFALLSATSAAPAAAADGLDKALPFIADDYARALEEARAQKLPLFIEAWAPW
jgi:endonuclease YncB( thermonuclease family)